MGEEQHLMSAIELDPEDTTTTPLPTRRRITQKLAFPSRTSVLQTTKRIIRFLLPSFLHFASASSSEPTDDKILKSVHPTAWLDGMRGIAALLVYVYHLSYSTHDVDTAWTYDGKQGFLRLPLIRFFYDGHFMVAIFFVLSGYALSYKPVKQIRNGELQGLGKGLASSVFRRWMRLFLPCFVSTLMIVLLLRLGVYDLTREIANDQKRLPFHRERHAGRYERLGEQIWAWTSAFSAFANPFTARDMPIDPHLWTISIEYGASIVLYVTQLCLCRLRTRYRVLSLVFLVFMAHQADHWPNILFFSGLMLAELDHRRRSLALGGTSSNLPPFSSSKRSDLVWSITYICMFICGLYLGGQPEFSVDKAPGWQTLYSLIPKHVRSKHRYWVNWGAILLIWSTSNSCHLQKIFTNRVSQYLGKISFSLYLIHGMVIHTLHYSLMPALWEVVGSETWLKRETAFGISATVVTVCIICISDVFMRGVDIPSVRFAKWVEGKCNMKVQIDKEEPKWMEASVIV